MLPLPSLSLSSSHVDLHPPSCLHQEGSKASAAVKDFCQTIKVKALRSVKEAKRREKRKGVEMCPVSLFLVSLCLSLFILLSWSSLHPPFLSLCSSLLALRVLSFPPALVSRLLSCFYFSTLSLPPWHLCASPHLFPLPLTPAALPLPQSGQSLRECNAIWWGFMRELAITLEREDPRTMEGLVRTMTRESEKHVQALQQQRKKEKQAR